MRVLWQGIKVGMAFSLIAALVFTSGILSVLLYGKYTGRQLFAADEAVFAEAASDLETGKSASAPPPAGLPVEAAKEEPKPTWNTIDAPIIRQYPQLPSGCEITSLTMLLQFYGIKKDKMELVPELKKDTTPLVYNADGSIRSWGNPNTGFVGEMTGKSKGFGVYHTALFDLLSAYVPTAVDLTREPFERLEKQIAAGIPAVVWTTINFEVPDKWVIWDTPIGPIQTTFMEHAVLLVGVDEQSVYVNDPYSGKQKLRIDKTQFKATWEAMGRQALSYK